MPDIPDEVLQNDIAGTFLLGRFEPEAHPDFVVIPEKYASREGMVLQKIVLDSFVSMALKAKEAGVALKIISATRNFDRQKAIWERKWEEGIMKYRSFKGSEEEKGILIALEILKFSSMPGTSRHHWGTDIDINSLDNNYFISGKGKKEYEWLVENAAGFGFCQPYNQDPGRTGYREEKWHWSFSPLSGSYLKAYRRISYDNLTGFEGASCAEQIDVIKNYVYGVACADGE